MVASQGQPCCFQAPAEVSRSVSSSVRGAVIALLWTPNDPAYGGRGGTAGRGTYGGGEGVTWGG